MYSIASSSPDLITDKNKNKNNDKFYNRVIFQVLVPVIGVSMLGGLITFIKYRKNRIVRLKNIITNIKLNKPHKDYKHINVNPVFAKDKVSFNPINKNWQNHY